MMNYNEVIDYLYNQTPMFQKVGSSAYKEGLDNTLAIDSRLNHPHKKYATIHVAGTNGKGSTSHILASILQQAGYKTGLYTSPHLVNFTERIRVNGKEISENYIVSFVNEHLDFFNGIQPSFFEVTTALAFSYFAFMEVDVAIIEVGLGGRLDCTNIIHPDLSIITNISFDHMAQLGNTLTLIAIEKAGIIKPGIPVVIGEYNNETKPVFIRTAHEKQAPIVFAEDENPVLSSRILPSGQWEFNTAEYPALTGELGGLAQEKNAATILCSINKLKEIGYNIPSHAVYEGFSDVIKISGLRGRWEIVGKNPTIVMDTGHNPAGMEYIVQQLRTEKYNRLHIIIGMVNDKDIHSILKILPREAIYYFTKASVPRALDEYQLKEEALSFNLHGECYNNVKEAFTNAKNNSVENDFIFIGGSTFIVADFLSDILSHS